MSISLDICSAFYRAQQLKAFGKAQLDSADALTETLEDYLTAATNFHNWLNATDTDLKRSEGSLEILSHQQMKTEMDRFQVQASTISQSFQEILIVAWKIVTFNGFYSFFGFSSYYSIFHRQNSKP